MFTSKWHMNRLGLVDFWYYVNEEFTFKDGHMLLRGSNGSGKSVTMQSFIPLLLDGNKSSERLDSFGTRSRKLENYLIEEDSDRDSRIGYLYLEFKREDSDVYKTIGMGLYARKNKPLDSWYFVIEDNRRINYDLHLLDGNLAISKQVLKNLLKEQVIETQKEYMKKVNDSLFGFNSLDDYKDVISLLLQLRSPKLSNSLKPTMINEVLSNSLQTLSEDDLRPMSEAIANMDDLKDQLDALKLSYNASQAILQVYKQYNVAVLKEKFEYYCQENKLVEKLKTNKQNEETEIEQARKRIDNNSEELKQKEVSKNLLIEERSNYLKDDLILLAEELEKNKDELVVITDSVLRKITQVDNKESLLMDVKTRVKRLKDELDQAESNIKDTLADMDELQENLSFSEHSSLKNEVLQQMEQCSEANYDYVNTQISNEVKLIKEGLNEFQTLHEKQGIKKRYEDEKENLLSKSEEADSQIEKLEAFYNEIMEETKEKFFKLNQDNQVFVLNDQEMQKIVQVLHGFRESDNYYLIDSMMVDKYQSYLKALLEDESKCSNLLKDKMNALKVVSDELEMWQVKTDNEPTVNETVLKNRQFLDSNHIDYKPLYRVLEFNNQLDIQTQNKWEEALNKIGILNALLINTKDKEFVLTHQDGLSDVYLFTNYSIKELDSIELVETSDRYLDIKKMMQDIGVDQHTVEYHDDWIETGLFAATLSNVEESLYIGQIRRQQYRKNKIDTLQIQINEYNLLINDLHDKKNKIQESKEVLFKELNQMPRKDDMDLAKRGIHEAEENRKYLQTKLSNVNEEIQKISNILAIHHKRIVEIATKLQIDATFELFKSRLNSFNEYRDLLNLLKSRQYTYVTRNELSISLVSQEHEIIIDLDELRSEKENLNDKQNYLSQAIQQKEEQLEKAGYGSIKPRLEEISDLLKSVDQQINELNKKMIEDETLITYKMEEIEKVIDQLDKQIHTCLMWENIYKQELDLGYCIEVKDRYPIEQEISQFLNQNGDTKRKEDLMFDLQEMYHKQISFLQEYNLTLLSLFKEDRNANRLDISARYRGKNIKFSYLHEQLALDIIQQSTLLEESDRLLIEEILVNNLSNKIRRLMIMSESWVKNINGYIRDMNTSSGLKLKLEWKSKRADNEETLETNKLVKLLKSDILLMKEEDHHALSHHFRKKIEAARRLSEKNDISESFHQIMKNTMDYRTWFDFTIYFEKGNDRLRELSNNAFFQLSGGEKAMSMYIPLFSAVAAKFKSANEDAPLLIALDEAFAGVDEKNIDNMFALIGKFKFDYIMNSQVLWGDYQSVRALKIHELFRPENARFVSVISYEWDGKVKRMVEQ